MTVLVMLCIFLPMLASVPVLFMKKKNILRDGFSILVTLTVLLAAVALAWGQPDGASVSLLTMHFARSGFQAVYAVVAAFMWFCAALLSPQYFRGHHHLGRYHAFFLITLGATMGVFLSADLITTFIFFEIMSFASYTWVVQEQDPEAMSAGKTYLAIAVLGGMVLLMGLFLLYDVTGTLVIADLAAAVDAAGKSPKLYIAAFCMLTGFGAKAGLFPLHIWLPRAHPVAPAPASALLSGVLTKTGVFGILLITANILAEDPIWGYTLLILGAITMLLGAVIAVFSTNLKRTLACSSMSQIGFITVGVSMITLLGEENALAANGTVLYMINHSLVKLVLFLGAGAIYAGAHTLDINKLRGYGRNKPMIAVPFFLGACSLAGIPGLCGYLSKTLIHESLVEYAEIAGTFITAIEWLFLLSGGLTAAYMLKLFITIFVEKPTADTPTAHGKISPLSAAALILAAVALPVLGVLPHLLTEKISYIMIPFVGGHEFHHEIQYFSLANLKGIFISLGIGIAVYLLVIRRLLMKQQDDRRIHYNPLEGVFSLEKNVYKPLFRGVLWVLTVVCRFFDHLTDFLFRGVMWVLTVVCRFFDHLTDFLFRGVMWMLTVVCRFFNDLTDFFVLVAKKTVFRPAKDPHEPHERRYAYALGRFYGRVTQKDANHCGEAFVQASETISKTTWRLSGNFSFALLMACFGICVILLIILFVGMS